MHIDDDEVLLATSDDEEPGLRGASGAVTSDPGDVSGEGGAGGEGHAASSTTDMVMADEDILGAADVMRGGATGQSPGRELFGGDGPSWKPNWPTESVGTS